MPPAPGLASSAETQGTGQATHTAATPQAAPTASLPWAESDEKPRRGWHCPEPCQGLSCQRAQARTSHTARLAPSRCPAAAHSTAAAGQVGSHLADNSSGEGLLLGTAGALGRLLTHGHDANPGVSSTQLRLRISHLGGTAWLGARGCAALRTAPVPTAISTHSPAVPFPSLCPQPLPVLTASQSPQLPTVPKASCQCPLTPSGSPCPAAAPAPFPPCPSAHSPPQPPRCQSCPGAESLPPYQGPVPVLTSSSRPRISSSSSSPRPLPAPSTAPRSL